MLSNLVDRTLLRIAYPVSKLSLVNTELITYKANLVDRTLFRIAYPVSKLSLVNTELITYAILNNVLSTKLAL
jgi:hypothetical protein